MWPWSTRVVSPPTAEATTGVPQAAASSATRPKDSERLGHETDVGGPVVRRQQLVGLGLDEVDVVAHAPAVGHVERGRWSDFSP